MSTIAEGLEELMGLGVGGAALVAAIRRLEEATYGAQIKTLEQAVKDATRIADEKRVKDAERQRRRRMSPDIAGCSVTTADVTGQPPLPLSPPPQTPPPHTPTPPDITTRARGGGFALFWESYPNKTGKLAAEKAYARALIKISGPDPPAVLLAGVERAKTSRGWGEGFIPHPTTWLNRGGWDDEPAEIIPITGRTHEQPHPDAKQLSRQANHARADGGALRASGRDWKP